MGTSMETVNISDLRANLLKYLEKANSGQHITVTSNGKVLATLSPPVEQREAAKNQLRALSETARIHDVTGPIDVDWEAAQ